MYFNLLLHWKRPNLTIGVTYKVASEGNKLYFVGDNGKEAHFPLSGKRLIETSEKAQPAER